MINKKAYLNPKLFDKDVEQIPNRHGFGDALVELGRANPNVYSLTADLAESTRAHLFAKEFPNRFVEIGIAEQNLVGVAAGLAKIEKIPFVSDYATFCPGRSWDQVRVSVCYSQQNVKIAGAHTGISVGPDGATHQALEDIAIMRCLPLMTVVVPCDYEEAKKTTHAAAEMVGPFYFRFAREKTPVITTKKTPFKVGRAEIFREGKDVSIIACGPLLYEALVAAEVLKKEGIDAEVINNHTIKPIDTKTLVASAKKTGCVVTVEEHQVMGGAGSAVAECLVKNFPVPMEFVGMQDSFGESGEPNELLAKYHMKSRDIISAVKKVIKRK